MARRLIETFISAPAVLSLSFPCSFRRGGREFCPPLGAASSQHAPAGWTPPGTLFERPTPRLHPRPAESEPGSRDLGLTSLPGTPMGANVGPRP